MPGEAKENQEILDALNTLDIEFKKRNDEQLKEIEKHGTELSHTKEKLVNIESALDKKEEQLEQRLDDIELKMDTPAQETPGISDAEKRHIDAWEDWVRDSESHEKQAALQAATKEVDDEKRKKMRKKDVSTTSSSTGGYAVPEVISRVVGEKLQDISDMRRIVRVESVGTSDYKEIVDVGGEGYGWVGETDVRAATDTAGLEECAPTMGFIYAYPKVTEESLDDIFFNVQNWIVRQAVRGFAKGEGVAFITGNGTKKPTGFLNATPSVLGDEESSGSPLTPRPYGTVQYVPTGSASGFLNSPTGSPLSFGGDVFIDIEQELKPGYRRNARYLMNKSTQKLVRKFKDSDGNYIWQRSMVLGTPNTINGYPVEEFEAMPSVGANAYPVALGDFEEGYLAVDRTMLRMTVDDNITLPGYVKFYIRRRLGGAVYNDDAIKVMKCATS